MDSQFKMRIIINFQKNVNPFIDGHRSLTSKYVSKLVNE